MFSPFSFFQFIFPLVPYIELYRSFSFITSNDLCFFWCIFHQRYFFACFKSWGKTFLSQTELIQSVSTHQLCRGCVATMAFALQKCLINFLHMLLVFTFLVVQTRGQNDNQLCQVSAKFPTQSLWHRHLKWTQNIQLMEKF